MNSAVTPQFSPQRSVNRRWMAVTNTADDFGDEPGQKVHSQCPRTSVPRYLSSGPPLGSRDRASTLAHVVPKTGAERRQEPGFVTESRSCVGGTFFVFIIIFVCKTRWSKYQVIMVFWSDLLEHVLESVDLGQSYYCGFHAKAWENPGSLPLFSLAGLYGFSAWQESPILKVLANIVQFVTPRLMI